MRTMGIDVGNVLSKVAILDGDELIADGIMETTGNIASEIVGFVQSVLAGAGLDREGIEAVAGTGSGTDLLDDVDFVEDEVVCVGSAAAYLLDEVEIVIDIGGQSITAILLHKDGDIANFMRNDKCASGSGRFLEVMSGAMGVDVADIDEIVARAEKPVLLSSQCGVFAESEIITHVNEGEETQDIVAGICDSVANIVVAQARRFGLADHYTITGGVARIESVVRVIEMKLSGTYHKFPYDPRLAAAIGAALLGQFEEE